MRQIDIEKSILKHRVIYKVNRSLVFEYMFMYFLALILPVMSLKVIVFPLTYNPPIFFLDFLILLVDIWLLANLYYINRLIIAKGSNLESNKIVVKKILDERYPDITFTSGNPNLLRGEKSLGVLKQREEIISIIFNESDIYLNVLHTYRQGSFSFVHGMSDYITGVRIAKSFEHRLLST